MFSKYSRKVESQSGVANDLKFYSISRLREIQRNLIRVQPREIHWKGVERKLGRG
jgi:hypothetical protein